MSDKVFVDSNIIVYAYDRHEPEKLAKAQSILRSGIAQESAVLSAVVKARRAMSWSLLILD